MTLSWLRMPGDTHSPYGFPITEQTSQKLIICKNCCPQKKFSQNFHDIKYLYLEKSYEKTEDAEWRYQIQNSSVHTISQLKSGNRTTVKSFRGFFVSEVKHYRKSYECKLKMPLKVTKKDSPSSLRLWAAFVISLLPPCSCPWSLLLRCKMRIILRSKSQAACREILALEDIISSLQSHNFRPQIWKHFNWKGNMNVNKNKEL